MSLSADQREAIAEALQRLWDSPAFDNTTDEETGALIADTLEPLVDGLLGEAHAEHAPDESPGDVIAAYPDGTIVLDDGITTWNPRRATEFLVGEARRDERERADRFRAAIQRIGAARVYEDGELAKGVSVELAGAIVDALGVIEESEATP